MERAAGEVDAFYRGTGCSRCRNTGFSGRIGIYELLVPDQALLDLIGNSPGVTELRQRAIEGGMVTLRQDGMAKVKAGITTLEEVFRATAAF